MDEYIEAWVSQALADEDFSSYKVELNGGTENGGGFVGDVLFVKVHGVAAGGKAKHLHLVLKVSKDNVTFRENLGMVAFHQEIIIYEDVFPAFEAFQRQKQIRTPFCAYPRCFKCLKLENKEVLALEDLNLSGYRHNDRNVCMNLAHIKMVLRQYARLHALSFALRDQNKPLFDSLAVQIKDSFADFLLQAKVAYDAGIQEALDLLKESGDEDLYQKYRNLSENGADRLIKIVARTDEQSVIVHGDCWNNNFMFQYENNNQASPTSVMILDWQFSSLKSPAYDLAYFLYTTGAKSANLFHQFLQEYHKHLSDFLIELGSSPNLFTFEDLQRHWKDFQLMSLLFIPTAFKFVLGDKDDLPDFSCMKGDQNLGQYLSCVPRPKSKEYYERLKCAVKLFSLIMNECLESWVKEAIASEDISSYEVELRGSTENGDSFIGQVLFVEVQGIDGNGKPKQLHLAVKLPKENATFRENMGKMSFHQEIIIYEDVFPAFERFQHQRQIRNPFSAHPRCFKCLKLEDKEVLALEDLNSAGYAHHNKDICMNLAHIRMVLREYAKLHALSLALRDQNKPLFDSLTRRLKDPFVDFLSESKAAFNTGIQEVLDLLQRSGDEDLYQKYKELSKGGADRLVEIIATIDEKAVIVHGDCWNNNFMFQYKNNDNTSPTNVMILDWQFSSLKSPAYDLAYFLYTTSTRSANLFHQYLQEYHKHLSDFLIQLGSSPNLFTFEDLQSHWKDFQIMGLLFIPTSFKFVVGDKDNLPDFSEIVEGQKMGDYLRSVPLPKNKEFYERLKCAIEFADV
nr:unnamed protein product [Callosobruchus chinensis]